MLRLLVDYLYVLDQVSREILRCHGRVGGEEVSAVQLHPLDGLSVVGDVTLCVHLDPGNTAQQLLHRGAGANLEGTRIKLHRIFLDRHRTRLSHDLQLAQCRRRGGELDPPEVYLRARSDGYRLAVGCVANERDVYEVAPGRGDLESEVSLLVSHHPLYQSGVGGTQESHTCCGHPLLLIGVVDTPLDLTGPGLGMGSQQEDHTESYAYKQ